MSSYVTAFKATDYMKRYDEAKRVIDKYPDKCSVIVGRAEGSDVPEIDRHKFLTPRELTVGQFSHMIRERLDIPSEKALFLFSGKVLPVASLTMGCLYDQHKDRDEFLYISYTSENTFGAFTHPYYLYHSPKDESS